MEQLSRLCSCFHNWIRSRQKSCGLRPLLDHTWSTPSKQNCGCQLLDHTWCNLSSTAIFARLVVHLHPATYSFLIAGSSPYSLSSKSCRRFAIEIFFLGSCLANSWSFILVPFLAIGIFFLGVVLKLHSCPNPTWLSDISRHWDRYHVKVFHKVFLCTHWHRMCFEVIFLLSHFTCSFIHTTCEIR